MRFLALARTSLARRVFFQFSLWDSYPAQSRVCHASISFNSLYEIPSVKCVISMLQLFFQFSLWDSIDTIAFFICSCITFNSLYEILIICSIRTNFNLTLSILFMRFRANGVGLLTRPRYFQFSLWDSKWHDKTEIEMYIDFQFSLWDSILQFLQGVR